MRFILRDILTKLLLAITLASFTATSANAMFVQPDWWEVTEPGVGTNRYAYSMGDPVNKSDPSGHQAVETMVGTAAFASCFATGVCEAIGLGLLLAGAVSGVAYLIHDMVTDNDVASEGGLKPDGTYVTPGGREIGNHGAKGNGEEYIGGKGHSPEDIDGIIDGGIPQGETKIGDGRNGGAATLIEDENGQWVVIGAGGRVIAISDKDHPERGKPELQETEDEDGN